MVNALTIRDYAKEIKKMKTRAGFAALSLLFAAGHSFAAGTCDNNSLKGSYSFRVQGANLGLLDSANVFHPFTSPEPFAGIGQYMFDGEGSFTRTDYNVGLGTPAFPPSPVNDQGFRTGVTGTYSVSQDCTGTIVVGLLTTGTQIVLAVSVVDYGQAVFGVIKTEHASAFSSANNTSDLACTGGCDVAVNLSFEAQFNSTRRR
ncbi:hypothetical protein [Rhodopila sp.]|uniref:hypothetical protein n=1 Tax=Rhodopila sp. TaxID=2480087 RepID=UPI003D09F891